MTHFERLFAALYVSEIWYSWYLDPFHRTPREQLYGRTRGIILFDRVITGELNPIQINNLEL